jgi:cation:H+ antiporter
MLIGVGVVLVSGTIIVDKTLYFADVFKISPFVISLIVLSIGTNLPELSLAIRSVLSGNKDVAFGDYLGSASANTLLFGIFTLLNNGPVKEDNSQLTIFVFIAGGLTLFYFFARSKNTISRAEGVIMLSAYILFIVLEFI